jgi:glycosyltransferase involved in cell wall biosynthesis
LTHLKKVFPSYEILTATEFIVVDSGCSEGTASWVRNNHPHVQVVELQDEIFNNSRARNAGAAVANGDYLMFIDADVIVKLDLAQWLVGELQQNTTQAYWTVNLDQNPNLWGTNICKKTAFDQLQGYDEAFVGWSGEDVDFYYRLDHQGFKRHFLPNITLEAMPHANSIRQISKEMGGLGSVELQLAANRLYRNIKYDVEAIQGSPMTLDSRKLAMQSVRQAISRKLENPKSAPAIRLNVPHRMFNNKIKSHSEFTKELVYTITLSRLQREI